MERTVKIKIFGKEEEIILPEREVRHTRYVLKQVKDIKELGERNYDIAYHTVYIMLKEIFPKLEYKDVDRMLDDDLNIVNRIAWNISEEDVKTGNFRKTAGNGKK